LLIYKQASNHYKTNEEIENMNDNKLTDTLKRELRISRIFDAPRELVWKASTEPERMKMWWGPETFTIPFVNIDFQVGGKYLVCMRSPDNKDFWSAGSYLEIDPYKKLAMTDSFADENGNVVSASFYGMSSDFPMESRVEFNFDEDDNKDKTRFTMVYEDVSGIPEEHLKDMTQGWNEMFDKLTRYLAAIGGSFYGRI